MCARDAISELVEIDLGFIRLVGKQSNCDGIGESIKLVTAPRKEQYTTVRTAGSCLSVSDRRVHCGLGTERSLKYLEIRRPSSVAQRVENVDVNQILTIAEVHPPRKKPYARPRTPPSGSSLGSRMPRTQWIPGLPGESRPCIPCLFSIPPEGYGTTRRKPSDPAPRATAGWL